MTYLKPTLLLALLMTTALAASPGGRHHRHHHGRRVVYVGASFHYPSYHYADPFRGPVYGWAPYGATHRGLELADADSIISQIEALHTLKEQGILTEREFRRAKRTLLDRLGKYVPRQDSADDAAEVTKRLEQLNAMKVKGLIEEREFVREKRKLLRLI